MSALMLVDRRRRRWSARVLLYVVIPKGFLPQQDTGVIVAVDARASRASRSRA